MARVGDKIYKTAAWQKLRRAYMSSQNWICEKCGAPAVICHHKQPITAANVDNPKITLNFENLQALCLECHNKIHNDGNSGFNENGEIIGTVADIALADFKQARQAIEQMQF